MRCCRAPFPAEGVFWLRSNNPGHKRRTSPKHCGTSKPQLLLILHSRAVVSTAIDYKDLLLGLRHCEDNKRTFENVTQMLCHQHADTYPKVTHVLRDDHKAHLLPSCRPPHRQGRPSSGPVTSRGTRENRHHDVCRVLTTVTQGSPRPNSTDHGAETPQPHPAENSSRWSPSV